MAPQVSSVKARHPAWSSSLQALYEVALIHFLVMPPTACPRPSSLNSPSLPAFAQGVPPPCVSPLTAVVSMGALTILRAPQGFRDPGALEAGDQLFLPSAKGSEQGPRPTGPRSSVNPANVYNRDISAPLGVNWRLTPARQGCWEVQGSIV